MQVEIDKNIIEFLNRKDVQDALANNDMQAFYELVAWNLSEIGTGAITKLLIEAGVDPLQGMTEIPDVFLYRQQDITKFNIPEGIVKIRYGAFNYSGLESIYIPDSVREIDDHAFNGTESLKEVRLPRGIKLGVGCFARSGLESIELEDLKSGGRAQFNNCKNLKSAVIKGSTAYLPGDLFENCSNLTYVELPAALEGMGCDVFCGCSRLRKINFTGTAGQWKQMDPGMCNARLRICKIICSDSTLKFDKTLRRWIEV